ncbi:hypothetical protein VKT23_008648 [Stygiomarasmius scandens]|uniref:Uncharacterized protein n=1 Tax=Marasmiellus scandens TaxID=2682957 RepID=A0ABR1JMC7_9AGAR
MQQLIGWFYNDGSKRKQQGIVSSDAIQNIIVPKSRSKGNRSHTNVQNFSATHYVELIKPKVDQELEQMRAQTGNGKLAKGAHLPVVVRVTKDIWESLPEDVKTDIRNKKEDEDLAQQKGIEGRKIIDEFPRYLTTICNNLHRQTNFAVSMIVGGWSETQQQIVVHGRFHAGENELGLPFNTAHQEYKTQWADIFGAFVSNYIKAECIQNPDVHPPVGPKKSLTPTQSSPIPGPSLSPALSCQSTDFAENPGAASVSVPLPALSLSSMGNMLASENDWSSYSPSASTGNIPPTSQVPSTGNMPPGVDIPSSPPTPQVPSTCNVPPSMNNPSSYNPSSTASSSNPVPSQTHTLTVV